MCKENFEQTDTFQRNLFYMRLYDNGNDYISNSKKDICTSCKRKLEEFMENFEQINLVLDWKCEKAFEILEEILNEKEI
jgi:hypothetical protein